MASATVASSALLSFTDDIASDTQTDVRNTILLAILHANSSTDRNKDSTNAAAWFTAYWAYLQGYGWAGPDPTALSSVPLVDYNAPVGVNVTLVQQLGPLLDSAQAALLNRVLLSLPLSGGATAQSIFGQQSTDKTTDMAPNSADPIQAVNFMVGVSYGTPSGNVVLESCHISYRYIPPDVLFGFTGRIFNIQAVSHTIEFNCANYATSGGVALSNSNAQLVSSFDIGPEVASSSGSPISESQSQGIIAWAQDHIVKREQTLNNQVVAVDYIEINRGPETASNGYPFDIVLFQVLEISGWIDLASWACNFSAYLRIPLLPFRMFIGGISGSLHDGITLAVGITGIATGSITLHILNTDELYCDVKLQTIVGNWDKDLDICKIPFL